MAPADPLPAALARPPVMPREGLACVLLSREGGLLSAPLPDLSALFAARSSCAIAAAAPPKALRLEAVPVALPSFMPAATGGLSLHFSGASGLLLASVEAPGGGRHQLLLRLDASGTRCLEACEWDPWPTRDTAECSSGCGGGYAASGGGALRGMWEVPLLPPARAHLRCPQLMVCSEEACGGGDGGCVGVAPRAAVVALSAEAAATPGGSGAHVPGRAWVCCTQRLPLQRGGGDIVGTASLPCPATCQTVVIAVTSAGNLLLYATPPVPGLALPPPPPEADEAALQVAVPAAAAAAAAAVAPYDEPERSELVNDRVRVSGDVSHIPGGSPAVSRLLLDRSDPESYFEAPAPGAVRLVLRLPSDAGLALVGARLLLGASGAAYAPTQAVVGEGPGARAVPLAPRDGGGAARRWYPLLLAPAEGLGHELVLQIGPAREPGLRVRVHQVDVFAQPRTTVARRAADIAAAAGSCSGVEVTGPSGAAAALALAAASEPGGLVVLADGAAEREREASLLLRCATAALEALPPGEAAAAAATNDGVAQGAAWQVLCPLVPADAGCEPGLGLERGAWGLLRALAAAHGCRGGPAAAAERLRDTARLAAARALLSGLARQAPAGRATPWEDAQAFAYLHAVALAASVTMHGPDVAMQPLAAVRGAPAETAGTHGALPCDASSGASADAVRCLPHVLSWLRVGARSAFLPQALLRPLARALLQLLAAEAFAAGASEAWPVAVDAASPVAAWAAELLLSGDPELRAAAASVLPEVADAWGPVCGVFLAALAAAVSAHRGLPGLRMLPAYGAITSAVEALSDTHFRVQAAVGAWPGGWARDWLAHELR
jgi:hypothetical protein